MPAIPARRNEEIDMSEFIYNAIEAAAAGHEFNVIRVHADGSFSRAFVKPGCPSSTPFENYGDAMIVVRMDGLLNVYVRGDLQAVAENDDGARKYVKSIGKA